MRATRTTGRRGVTLVEVLVTMSIFIIGILAIARLFPQGFGTLRYGEHATMAASLARAFEEYLRGRAENLPLGVASVGPGGVLRADVQPGEFLSSPSFPGFEHDDPRFTVLNQARRIIGETFTVPAPTANSPYVDPPAPISLYTLLFAPLYSVEAVPGESLGVVVYSGTSLRVQQVGEDQDLDEIERLNLDLETVLINYDTNRLFFRPVPFERSFRLAYRFADTSETPLINRDTHPDEFIIFPAGEHSVELDLPPSAYLVRGTERFHRVFRELEDPAEPFSADPYEYRILNPITGLIGVNPLGARVAAAATDRPGLLVRVDYDVDDWWILREERVIPSDPEGPQLVKLAVPHVKRFGSVEDWINFDEDDNALLTYAGLVRRLPGKPFSTPGIDLLVVDMETGLVIDSTTLQEGGLNGEIDYRRGEVRFRETLTWSGPDGFELVTDAAGRNIRVFYRGAFDWAVSLRKPYARYTYQPEPDPEFLEYRQFSLGSFGYLFFPSSDANHSVLIDYRWHHEPTGRSRIVTGEAHRVKGPGELGGPNAVYGAGSPLWWVRVGHAYGDPGNTDDTFQNPAVAPGSVEVIAVRGASFDTHVVWRDGFHWRHQRATTVLEANRR